MGNCHFIIELMSKYINICSYFYGMTSVQILYVDVMSIKMELRCLFILKLFTREEMFSLFCGFTHDSHIFVNLTCKLFHDWVLIIFLSIPIIQKNRIKDVKLQRQNIYGVNNSSHSFKILLRIIKITC